VWWPDQGADTTSDRIAAGYQGEDYFTAVVSFGLCAQVARQAGRTSDPRRAAAWAKKGAEVLVKMSAPEPPHAPNPLHDDGYGIRFYGIGMAVGYDWLYEALSADERARVWRALDRWLDVYENKGFGRDHPVGNYFASYYAAKALAALATEGDDPGAGAAWEDWLRRLYGKMVQPYFAAHLVGGGWPEGWNYGPLATINMALPVVAARTAKGLDLLHDTRAPFSFVAEQPLHLMHFTWPSRRTLDDRGAQHAGPSPSRANPALFHVLAGLLELERDPLAPRFHRYAREVAAAVGPSGTAAWQEMLFWDSQASEAEYQSLPLSYLARGMNTVAVRSSWATDAVWGAFTAGTYVSNADSGEMDFDQGSLAVVRGDRPLLCNTIPALRRHTPGTEDGDQADNELYRDLFGNNDKHPEEGNRTIYNIFYARASHFGQIPVGPEEAHTRVGRFEDGGAYVLMRGDRLEEMYRRPHKAERPVAAWTRQVVYLRPSLFVVDDRTRVADPAVEQWLAFHVRGPLLPVAGTTRFDVGAGGAFAGALTAVWPRGARLATTDLFGRKKVSRLEVRPAAPGAAQRWLTVIDAAARPADAARASALEAGGLIGVHLAAPGGNRVVLSGAGEAARGEIRYLIPGGPTTHVVCDLSPGARFRIEASPSGPQVAVRLVPGGDRAASAAGVLSFETR
jgi:hypothetical protein